MFLLVKLEGSLEFCKHALLMDHRGDSVTMNILYPLELAMPYFSALETNQKAFDMNGLQEKDQNFSAKTSSVLILILLLGVEQILCILSPACVFSP